MQKEVKYPRKYQFTFSRCKGCKWNKQIWQKQNVLGKCYQQQQYSESLLPMSDPNGNDVDTGNLIEYEILATEANGQYRVDGKYEATSKVLCSAGNFCFNKGLCMIWNEGTLSDHKSY